MGKTLKVLSFVLLSAALVMGGADSADAKKKKLKLTDDEKAMMDKWKVKQKKRAKYIKDIRKSPKFVGATKCNGSCHDPYYMAWKDSIHGKTFNLLKPGERES